MVIPLIFPKVPQSFVGILKVPPSTPPPKNPTKIVVEFRPISSGTVVALVMAASLGPLGRARGVATCVMGNDSYSRHQAPERGGREWMV